MTGVAAGAARRIAFRALEELRGGELVLCYPDGRGRRFGDGAGPRVVVDVRRPEAFWEKLARRTRVGFGESYVDGDWDTDDLLALVSLLLRNLEAASERPLVRALHRLQELRPDRSERQTPDAAPDNVRAHYDLGNELFALMLDPTMTYSCAYWERPEQTLEEAQRAKLRRVCEKLLLGPGDHVLEIGCGWGSFAIHAAGEHGCRVTGLTLSQAQAELARERVRAAGLDHLVEIRVQDYRIAPGQYSRIASIEMLEAIGLREYPTFFRSCDRLLAPDGVAVLQTIGVPDHRFERYRRTPDWIQRYVFPGSLLPSLEALARAIAGTRLMVVGLEEIGIFYARTLREWRERFLARLDDVRALGYDRRFERIWTFYLASCEAAFATRTLRDMQIVLTRPGNGSLPDQPAPRIGF
jgi:cyclopropane-fatty-acyl-phospholipid synthase